jgi:superfamily I DNA and/or RNA helicase
MLLPLAKKVVVLGDKKQFPNIIAMNSDRSIDDYYFQEILAL